MTTRDGMPKTFETTNGAGLVGMRTYQGTTPEGDSTRFSATRLDVRLVKVSFDLCIERERTLTRLGKKLGLVNDVTVGDAEFDAAFKIDGRPAELTRRYLNGEAREAVLRIAALSEDGALLVDLQRRPGLLRVDFHGWPASVALMNGAIDAARLLAERAALFG